jgi:hypothetical protein
MKWLKDTNMNKETLYKRRQAINEATYDQISEQRATRLLKKNLGFVGKKVEAVEEIPTDIRGFNIPVGAKGKVLKAGSWFDVYYVDFLVHGFKINVCCKSNSICSFS